MNYIQYFINDVGLPVYGVMLNPTILVFLTRSSAKVVIDVSGWTLTGISEILYPYADGMVPEDERQPGYDRHNWDVYDANVGIACSIGRAIKGLCEADHMEVGAWNVVEGAIQKYTWVVTSDKAPAFAKMVTTNRHFRLYLHGVIMDAIISKGLIEAANCMWSPVYDVFRKVKIRKVDKNLERENDHE